MSEGFKLSVPLNSDAAWEVDALDAGGVAVAFAPGDGLEAVVWQGADSGPLLAPTVSWLNAAQGKIQVRVSASQTAAVAPGVYPIEVAVIPASTGYRLRVLDAWLELTGSPGASASPPVYGTYRDLADFGGGDWLEGLRRKTGLANFTRERARARSYLDELIARKFRPFDGGAALWGGGYSSGAPDGVNPTVRDYLAADHTPGYLLPNGTGLLPGATVLVVDDGVKELVALKALELVCRQRVTLEAEDRFAARASYYRRLCSNLVKSTSVGLDVFQSGLPYYAFNLGAFSLR